MAHAVHLRSLASRCLRPIASLRPPHHQGKLISRVNHGAAAKGRTSLVTTAEHGQGKIRRNSVTRASTSGSSFRDASDAFGQAKPGKEAEETPQKGAGSKCTPLVSPSPVLHGAWCNLYPLLQKARQSLCKAPLCSACHMVIG